MRITECTSRSSHTYICRIALEVLGVYDKLGRNLRGGALELDNSTPSQKEKHFSSEIQRLITE